MLGSYKRCSPTHKMTILFQPATGRRHKDWPEQGRLLPPVVRGEEPSARRARSSQSRQLSDGPRLCLQGTVLDESTEEEEGREAEHQQVEQPRTRPHSRRCRFVPN